MKNLLAACTAALALLSYAALAHADTGCATVEVRNLRPGQGALMMAAYSDAESFNGKASALLGEPVTATTQQFSVCGLPGDTVALAVYQDVNGNGTFDRDGSGMPLEPWGASGQPAPNQAPTWESTHVPLDGAVLVVTMSG